MRKSDKKIDQKIINALTQVCESAQRNIDGFVWLTHDVNFKALSKSLKVTCVFASNEYLADYLKSANKQHLRQLIVHHLAEIDIVLQDANQQIVLVSEASFNQQHAKLRH
ncbi:hypothetical protein SAMN05216262_11365 [Colwellia chukchiensis]|uniref:Fis family transcriptional regulator n=1 Tax=Colwellia chukchiensis TaxID=641665 RepID=A0A1H7R344_9GAMM|nr:Fis family transcriptional regulator [Colwellia chukchiensis]SEL54670.1 hypothetical protein SAMN05216262_11365 [Colwellia chukchiensis]